MSGEQAPNQPRPEWQEDFHQARPVIVRLEQESRQASKDVVGPSVLRVAQLDADLLNREVWMQLRKQFRSAFNFFSVPFRYDLELDVVLSLLMFRHTVWRHNQGYGDQLQNVIYRSERLATALGRTREVLFSESVAPRRWEKLLLVIISILLPYGFQKLQRKAIEQDWAGSRDEWKRRINKWLHPLENYFYVVSFINLLVFLFEGKSRSLVDRVLGLRLVNHTSKVHKVWNHEFMERQLYWQHLTDFGTFIIPYVYVFPKLSRMFRGVRGDAGSLGLPANTCAICNANPIQVEGVTPCGHRFCYYCIESRRLAGSGSTPCPRCGEAVTEVLRPTAAPAASPRREGQRHR